MSKADFSAGLQVVLLFCATFVAFGSMASWNGAFSLQVFMLLPPCGRVNRSEPCCDTCLHVSHAEYSTYIALPSVVSIGSVVGGGLLIDVFGLPTAAILVALVNCLGSAVRAFGSSFVSHHAVMVSGLVLGQVLVESSAYSLLTCREYIAIRYFEERKRPLVISFAFGFSNTACVLSALVVPRIAANVGVSAAFWSLVGFSFVGVIVGFVLALTFRTSSAVQSLEQELCDEKQQRRSCAEVIRCARTFQPQYWFLFFAITLSFAARMVFNSNFPELENKLFNISAVQAGTNMGFGFIFCIVAALLMGGILWFIGPQVCVSLLATLVTTAFMALMFAKAELGIVAIGLYTPVMISVKSLYGSFVPPEALGLAGALMWANSLAFVGLYSILVNGFILKRWEGRIGATVALCFLIGSSAMSVCLLAVLWACYGNSSRDGNADSRERLLDGSPHSAVSSGTSDQPASTTEK